MTTKFSVHPIHLNKIAFEIVARALYTESLRKNRIETLPGLMVNFLASDPDVEEIHLAIFNELPVLSGDILLRLKVPAVHSQTIADIRAKLCDGTGRRCSVRDVIIFACNSIIAFPA